MTDLDALDKLRVRATGWSWPIGAPKEWIDAITDAYPSMAAELRALREVADARALEWNILHDWPKHFGGTW